MWDGGSIHTVDKSVAIVISDLVVEIKWQKATTSVWGTTNLGDGLISRQYVAYFCTPLTLFCHTLCFRTFHLAVFVLVTLSYP